MIGVTEKYFPFGSPLKKVQQIDRTPKKAFVLGVYASAVHSRWISIDGKTKVAALAVASEPSIFWNGEGADRIIQSIKIPKELGTLTVPSNEKLNGVSGKVLDEKFLLPLKLDRVTSWLCDLLPESRVNQHQRAAILRHYPDDLVRKFGLPPASVPDFDTSELDSATRRQEIIYELEQSEAEILILLGDLPIQWFLRFYDNRYTSLKQFGEDVNLYGKVHEIKIHQRIYKVIPLCHPRQAGRLGASKSKWEYLHRVCL